MWRVFGLLPIMMLLSCSTAPKMDALAAKASEGDPVSSCKLVVQDMRQCLAARDAWFGGTSSGEKPPCMADAVPARHETYLSDAVGKMKASNAKNIGKLVADGTFIVQAAFQIEQRDQVTSDKVGELLDALEKLCPALVQS